MSIGINPLKADIDSVAGDLAREAQRLFDRVKNLKYYLDGQTTSELVAKNYDENTLNEVSRLKSAINDLDQLRRIYEGTEALAAAKDFRTFARQLQGLGNV